MHSYEAILAGLIVAVLSLLENIILCPRHHDLILPFTPQNATFTASWCIYHFTPLEILVASIDLHAVQWGTFGVALWLYLGGSMPTTTRKFHSSVMKQSHF